MAGRGTRGFWKSLATFPSDCASLLTTGKVVVNEDPADFAAVIERGGSATSTSVDSRDPILRSIARKKKSILRPARVPGGSQGTVPNADWASTFRKWEDHGEGNADCSGDNRPEDRNQSSVESLEKSPRRLNQALVGLVLVGVFWVALLQTRRTSRQQDEIDSLRLQNSQLSDQLDRLTHEKDEAKRELASLRATSERQNTNHVELLRLRSEIAEFRRRPPPVSQVTHSMEVVGDGSPSQADLPDETSLTPLQRIALEHYAEKVKTGNSVADIDRMKDSLKRWEELYVEPSPPEMKAVLGLLKRKVQERLAELEVEADHPAF